MSLVEEIERLNGLRESGALSEEEYQQAKDSLLKDDPSTGQKLKNSMDDLISDDKTYAMLLHLSQFCTYLVPLAGVVVPVVMWIVKKDESPEIDEHGRHVINWIITSIIYLAVAGVLSFILIGIPLLFLLLVVDIVFPIVGAIKANDGRIWRYPGTINFI